MKRYKDELFTLKSKCVSGEKRWLKVTQISPGYTYPPPKILCVAFQMQYHKPNSLWTPQEWNNTRNNMDWWLYDKLKIRSKHNCWIMVSINENWFQTTNVDQW